MRRDGGTRSSAQRIFAAGRLRPYCSNTRPVTEPRASRVKVTSASAPLTKKLTALSGQSRTTDPPGRDWIESASLLNVTTNSNPGTISYTPTYGDNVAIGRSTTLRG